jgi:ABC-type amino acid transport system, permease component
MKKLFVCALLAAVLAAVPAFAQKTYVNGIDPDYPPFAYVDEKTGQPAGFDVDAMTSFTLCTAAYQSEYVRGALLSIRQGQVRAAQALGFGQWQTVAWIIIPQAARRALPGCGNEIIYLIKYSSLAYLVTCMAICSPVKRRSRTVKPSPSR